MNYVHLNQKKDIGVIKKLDPRFKSRIGFSTHEGTFILQTADILYLKAYSNYTEIHMTEGSKFVVCKTLKVIENLLPNSCFKRCHQSYIINLNKVTHFQDSIFLSGNHEIPVARRRRNEMKTWFSEKVNFL